MKSLSLSLLVLLLSFQSNAFASGQKMPLKTVDQVELDAYLGLWKEIYRIPNFFQDEKDGDLDPCFNTTAEYALKENGKISVTNTCDRKNRETGEIIRDSGLGEAKIANTTTNAELKVTFIPIPWIKWLFTGDYNVIGLGPKNDEGLYSWAMVGSKDRNYAWILVRENNLPEAKIKELLDRFEDLGFDSSRLIPIQNDL